MWNIPDHPDIDHAMRTGYPSWMQDPNDGYEDEPEEEEYERMDDDKDYVVQFGRR